MWSYENEARLRLQRGVRFLDRYFVSWPSRLIAPIDVACARHNPLEQLGGRLMSQEQYGLTDAHAIAYGLFADKWSSDEIVAHLNVRWNQLVLARLAAAESS